MNIFSSYNMIKQLYFPDKEQNYLIVQSKCQLKSVSNSHDKSEKLKQIALKKLFCGLPSVLQGITAEYFFDVFLIQKTTTLIQKNTIYLQAIVENLGLFDELKKRRKFDFVSEQKKFILSEDESSDLDSDEENESASNQEKFYAISNFFYQKNQKLKKAIENEQNEMIELLLNFGIIPDLNCLDATIMKDNYKLFNLFIDSYGLIPNQKTLAVALQTLGKNNKDEIIDKILGLGVEPDIYCFNVVITLNWMQMIDKFLTFNIKPTQESMNLAIEIGNIIIVQKLLDLKIEPSEKFLEIAIEEYKHDESIIDLFLNIGVIPSSSSILALIKYNVKNQIKLFMKLREHGATPDERCLVEAVQYQNLPMIELILKYVNPDTKCLNATIRKNSISLFERFIQLGAIPDESSLQEAVENSYEFFVNYLLDYGVRPTIGIISLAIDKDNIIISQKLMNKRDELIGSLKTD